MAPVDSFFKANSIAVIGASSNPMKVGYAILKNIIDFGFEGAIYPINLREEEILGLRAYKNVLEVEEPIDLAVFVVPARVCIKAAEDVGKKGIKNAVIITAGFKEVGIEGARLEKELLAAFKKYHINVLGPNCVGFIDTQNKLNASFTNVFPKAGSIALISQSGAIITSSIDWSVSEYFGFSKIISLGNKMDLNETDFLEVLASDPSTKVILMYLESIDQGDRFVEIAQQVVKSKPIVILKAGVSDAGAKAASSHTGALAGSKTAYSTAFKKAGIIPARNLQDLFNYGMALSSQLCSTDDSVVIITNAGGAGILATDAAEEMGLRLESFSAEEERQFRDGLPAAASVHNPIDILGDARADRYQFVLDVCAKIDRILGIIVIMSPQAVTEFKETTDILINFNKQNPNKQLIASYMGGMSNKDEKYRLRQHGIPCFSFPYDAIRSMAGFYQYSCTVDRPFTKVIHFEVDSHATQELFDKVLQDNRLVLLESEAIQVAKYYGLSTPPTQLATTPEDAIEFADLMGYPVVLKISSPDILHKSDLGGIILNITKPEEVRGSFNTIISRVSKRMPDANIKGISVQKMIKKKGKEIIIGVNKDPQFGHLIMCGLGGIYVNFLEDVAFRLNPINETEALQMLSETKAYKLLRGVRGELPSDISSLQETLLRISQLIEDHPLITELDINPLHVYPETEGVNILDIKITLERKES